MTCQCEPTDLSKLEPSSVWALFARIAAIPRASKKEERIRGEVRAIAQEQGLAVREEGVGNLVIEVPASAGCQGAPITVLQAHLDMVCEKSADSPHDFDCEGIHPIVDRDPTSGEQIVRADQTTLGADNGIGIALALAAACSRDVRHGPLELLFTVDEETGMTGANALTPDSLRGRRLLNLDSEEDDVLYIGCAGGCDAYLSFDLQTQAPGAGHACRVGVSGLRGGHSGANIHENRANAIKLLVRTLLRVDPETLRLASIQGGQLRNAIPRQVEAVVVGPGRMLDALRAAAASVADEAVRESAEEHLSIRVEPGAQGEVTAALSAADTSRVLATLAALPHGVLGMHNKIEGLVETSSNLATVSSTLADGQRRLHIEVGNLSRSSSASRQQEVLGQIMAVGKLAGVATRMGNSYPGWEPNMSSPTLSICRRVYAELFGREPRVTAIHAGLECGILRERVGNIDMVSLGPRIKGAHTPEEHVYVTSVQKSWKYLPALLAELARK
jgi:dipeptidase D